MIPATQKSRPARTIVFFALAIVLFWLIVSETFAAYLADFAPKTTLWLNPHQSTALISLADQALHEVVLPSSGQADRRSDRSQRGSKSVTAHDLESSSSAFEPIDQNRSLTRPAPPENTSSIRAWIEVALRSEPLNAHALRVLGELAEACSDDAAASEFMHAAASLSRHETVANLWMLRKSVQVGDDKTALYYADLLLRTTPELSPYVFPVLARMVQNGRSDDLLWHVLASKPPWREQFFEALPGNVTDTRIPLALLTALRTTSAPPTGREIDRYIDFLVARKLYDLAYYTWLQFLPPEELSGVGLLFNGRFSMTPSGSPFDWDIKSGSGVTVDVVPKPGVDGERALLVDFQFGRVDYHSVSELVVLAPGPYTFHGEYRGKIEGARGLKWRVACAGGEVSVIGESAAMMGPTRDWSSVTFTFTVPAIGCRAQYVRLDLDARMASETFLSGSMLFDDLQISRLESAPTEKVSASTSIPLPNRSP